MNVYFTKLIPNGVWLQEVKHKGVARWEVPLIQSLRKDLYETNDGGLIVILPRFNKLGDYSNPGPFVTRECGDLYKNRVLTVLMDEIIKHDPYGKLESWELSLPVSEVMMCAWGVVRVWAQAGGVDNEQYRDFIIKISNTTYMKEKMALALLELFEADMIKLGRS